MIILLNGPPRSGKDTIAKMIRLFMGTRCAEYKMSYPLKKAFKELLCLTPNAAKLLLENYKDDPLGDNEKYQPTPRDVQIALSEDVLKPLLGPDIFGRLAVNAMDQMPYKHFVISDIGFVDEIKPLQDHFGYTQVVGLQINRPNTSYKGDSRTDIDFHGMKIPYQILNNKYDLDLLERQVFKVLVKWELVRNDLD